MAVGSIKAIRTKIRSVNNIKKITRAMEMVSAAKLRKVQDRLMSVRPYASKIGQFLSGLASRMQNMDFPLFRPRETVKKLGLVVMSGEKGLCGSFNSNMARFVNDFIKKRALPYEITALGKKAVELFSKQGVKPVSANQGLTTETTFAQIQEWTGALMKAFLDGQVDEVWVLYTEYVNAVTFRPRAVRFLPVETEKTQDSGTGDYEFEPSPREILDRLIPRYVQTTFHRLLLESMSSEHAARMNAMHNATENAKDLVSSLTLIYNKARQASITKELLDIVGGAEALKG